jgi:hypothetical protein
MIERSLRRTNERLRSLRDELSVVEAQRSQLASDADDLGVDAVFGSPGASGEHRRAAEHAEAMTRHRDATLAAIAALERRQDELLDRLTGG